MMMFSTDPKTALQNAIAAAIRYAESAQRPERDAIRKLLATGIERLRMVEVLADDREPDDTPRIDSPNVRVNSEPPTSANLPNRLRDQILGRS
jgi:hypothetical protein